MSGKCSEMKSASIGNGDFGVDERTGLSAIATENAPAVSRFAARATSLLLINPEGDAGHARAE